MPEVTRQYLKQRVDQPDHHPFYQDWGQKDRVFLAATRRFETVPLPSLTSVRRVMGGQYRHWLEQHAYRLDAGACLVTGPGRRYAIEIDSPDPVETIEIHYSHHTASDTIDALRNARADQILDPQLTGPSDVFDQVHRHDGELNQRFGAIVAHLRTDWPVDPIWLDEAIRNLLACSLIRQGQASANWARIDAARAVTRRELFRRLLRARDAMEGDLAAPHRIAGLAAVACMSPFHFQRLFRQAFGVPVSAWLAARRLDHAHALLRRRDLDLTEIAALAGFAHLSSFSRAYRRRFGRPPSTVRREFRMMC